MKKLLPLLLAVLLCATSVSLAAAEEQDAAAMLARGAENLKNESSELVVRLERHRRDVITTLRFKSRSSLRDPSVAKSWILRLEPEAVAGIQMLALVPKEGKQTLKQYLSATGGIVTIMAPPDGQSLFGTHFKLRDLRVLDDARGTHKFVSRDSIEMGGKAHEVMVIETIPDGGPYSKVVRFLDSDKLLPLRIDYFNKAGHASKRLSVLAVAADAPIATHTRMELLGHTPREYTDMFIEEYRFNLDETALPERTFTDDYMKEVGEAYR